MPQKHDNYTRKVLYGIGDGVCVGGGRGEGADYYELQRNMANRGFLRIKLLKTTWTF